MVIETETLPPQLGYEPHGGAYDAMCAGDGTLREHWRPLIHALGALGSTELAGRLRQARRLLRDDGVTYSVHGDVAGLNRPWNLDPIPLLVSGEEWARLEAGLIQRAELLDLILTDLYGPRDLIRRGLLPAELIYSHRGFLRPCDGIRVPAARQLMVYAADLARSPDGHVWVLDDRAQAPSGAGYALKNRAVMSRILPGLYRDSHVQRLGRFFSALRSTLHAVAPGRRDDPRVVVLTPGQHNETYFEHAYLASYLGYSLVQGSDLTVRDGRVWLRALGGLEPVDVILRRTDDFFCDPLELRQDSRLGVPGLVEAARRGNVSIVNPLGCGVLENPGLLPFLPGIAKHFFAQELKLPSVATWWCGHEKERDYVLQNLDRLIVRSTHSGRTDSYVLGSRLSLEEKEQLRRRVQLRPHAYVGQEPVGFSSVPVLVDDRLEPRHAVCRAFLVAQGDSFVAMPGGLTRFAPEKETYLVSNQMGGVSKDTWVLGSEPEKNAGVWTESRRRLPDRAPHSLLPSRATEDLFWFGRYTERVEATIRLLRGVLDHIGESSELDSEVQCVHTLLRALTHLTGAYPGFVQEGAAERLREPQRELLSVVADPQRTGSVAFNLQHLLRVAYGARDLLSTDTWRVLNDVEGELRALQNKIHDLEEAEALSSNVLKALQALTGVTMESMVRGPGWSFLDMGRRFERAVLLISLLRSTLVCKHESFVESLLLESVLATAEALVSYRRSHPSHVRFETVLELLLLDENNPRSLSFQLERLTSRIAGLPKRKQRGHGLREDERAILKVSTELRLSDVARLSHVVEGRRQHLDEFLESLGNELRDAAEIITRNYFSHTAGQQQLVTTDADEDV